jgi:hypothetical protein
MHNSFKLQFWQVTWSLFFISRVLLAVMANPRLAYPYIYAPPFYLDQPPLSMAELIFVQAAYLLSCGALSPVALDSSLKDYFIGRDAPQGNVMKEKVLDAKPRDGLGLVYSHRTPSHDHRQHPRS